MNQYDIAAMLMTYSIKCTKIDDLKSLNQLLDELKKRIGEDERKKNVLEIK